MRSVTARDRSAWRPRSPRASSGLFSPFSISEQALSGRRERGWPGVRLARLARLALLALACLLVAVRGGREAAADEESDFFALESQIVTLSTKRPVEVRLAPSIVEVVAARDLRERGFATVGAALASIPGFHPVQDLVFQNFGVRGVNAGARGGSRVLKVMVDGQPIAFRSTTANFLGPELIPETAIERIEVVRGPGSALYGANAFLGVVNIVTRKGEDVGGAELRVRGTLVESTGRGGLIVEGTGGGAAGPLQVLATAQTGFLDRSRLDLPRSSPSIQALAAAGRTETEHDTERPLSFYTRIAYEEDDGAGVTLHGGLQRLSSASELQDLGPLPTLQTASGRRALRSRQSLWNGFARLEGRLTPGPDLELRGAVAFAAGGPDASDRFDTGQTDAFFLRQYGYRSIDLEAEAAYAVLESVHLTLGIDHTTDVHQLLTYESEQRATGARRVLAPADTLWIRNTGVYLQGIVRPTKRIALTMGLRLDVNSIYHEQLNGRVGLVYEVADDLQIKLLFGSSFQAPSPELLFGTLSQPGDILGNPDLDPQHALSWEAQLSWTKDPVTASITGFFNRIDQLAELVPVGRNLQAQNAADLDSYGLELTGGVRLGAVHAWANASYQRTLRRDRAARTPADLFPSREAELFPQWMLEGGLTWKVPALPLTLTGQVRWVDERRASRANVAVNQAPYTLDDYAMASVVLATVSDLQLGALRPFARIQVDDLFDESPASPGYNGVDVPALGRRFSFAVGVGF